MATCADCGKDIRDNDWTYGHCGAPVTKSGGAAPGGASPASDCAPVDTLAAESTKGTLLP